MRLPRAWLAGVFFVALSLLMLEITLTRVFSLILLYHLAVVSMSLALFGAAAGGICVYLLPRLFERRPLGVVLGLTALAYSISVVVALLIFIGTPVMPVGSIAGMLNLGIVYVDLALPFFFGGLCLAVGIKYLARNVSAVYFSDLVGAGAGCLLVIPALDWFGGPGAILFAAVLGAVGALAFALGTTPWRAPRPYWAWLVTAVALLALHHSVNLLQIEFVKGRVEEAKVFEGWNSFSRVAVFPEKTNDELPTWAPTRYQGENPGWMYMNIDGDAGTHMTRFDGDFNRVRFLGYDASSLVFHLRSGAHTLVIGPGGGRDILAALMFGESHVDGVELNPLIVDAVRNRFGEYTGHLYDDPRVSMTVDDGRNYLARSQDQYDILMLSAVDTFAATAAGAFALSENTLYTKEAFDSYYQHLSPDGMLSIGRFLVPADRYGEALRLTGLGLTTWRANGVANPRDYMVVVAATNDAEDRGYFTLLMKRSPFTQAEVDQVAAVADELGFRVLYAPFGLGHGLVRQFVMSDDYPAFWASYPLDISPPTDDRPFFFQMLRLSDIFNPEFSDALRYDHLRLPPVITLGAFLVIAGELTLAFILGPMLLVKGRALRRNARTVQYLIYFACIGVGFMMVEVGLMQKFILLMGHPTYALAVILFTILVASGLGSYLTRFVPDDKAAPVGLLLGVAMAVVIPLYIRLVPGLQVQFMGSGTLTKATVVVAALFPLGLMMGTFFPLAIRRLSRENQELIPWCWAINGATSVFASLLALAIGLQFGIAAELVVGWMAYLGAASVVLSWTLAQRQYASAREEAVAVSPLQH